MNIIELAEQAGAKFDHMTWVERDLAPVFERFAELVAAAEREQCAKHYLGIMRDAVEQAVLKEREACAKVCDDEARQSGSDHEAGGMYWCAEKIRERGDKHD